MATTKKSSSKSAGAFAVKGGKKGGMHNFAGATPQKSGVTATTSSTGKGAPFAKGGGGGKMHGFAAVKPQKSGRSGQS